VAAVTGRRIRVAPGPTSLLPGDEPALVDPAELDASLERHGPVRGLLRRPDGSIRPVLVQPVRRARPSDPQVVEVVVDGWRFELVVEDAAHAELRERAARAGAGPAGGGPYEVTATIPGRVVSIAVAPGDAVEGGQPLLVIEAMKMQNEVRAPRAGTVGRVAAAEGRPVELGDLLLVLE
jgi:biotin carboxyl carrier protein